MRIRLVADYFTLRIDGFKIVSCESGMSADIQDSRAFRLAKKIVFFFKKYFVNKYSDTIRVGYFDGTELKPKFVVWGKKTLPNDSRYYPSLMRLCSKI